MNREQQKRLQDTSGEKIKHDETISEYIQRISDSTDVDDDLTRTMIENVNESMFSPENNVNSDVIDEYITQIEQAKSNNHRATEKSIDSEHSDIKIIDNHIESENVESNGANTDERHRDNSSESKTGLTSIGWLKGIGRTRLNLISETEWRSFWNRQSNVLWVVLALCSIFGVYLAMTKPINYGFDAKVYTEQARYYARTLYLGNKPHYDQSPLLRYSAYALLLRLAGIPDFETSFRIGAVLTALLYFVLVPFLLFRLIEDVSDTRYAWGGLAGWIVFQFVQWPINSFQLGKWQYSYTLSLLLAAIWMANKGFTTNYLTKRLLYALLSGIILGVAGLTQYTYTVVGIMAISIIGLRKRQMFTLSVICIVGLPFLIFGLLFSSPEHFHVLQEKFTRDSGSVRSVEMILKVALWKKQKLLAVGGLIGLMLFTKKKLSQTRIIEVVGIIILTFWIWSSVITGGGQELGWTIQFVGGVMLFTMYGHQVVAIVEKLIVGPS